MSGTPKSGRCVRSYSRRQFVGRWWSPATQRGRIDLKREWRSPDRASQMLTNRSFDCSSAKLDSELASAMLALAAGIPAVFSR
jgi:hypothetical protein